MYKVTVTFNPDKPDERTSVTSEYASQEDADYYIKTMRAHGNVDIRSYDGTLLTFREGVTGGHSTDTPLFEAGDPTNVVELDAPKPDWMTGDDQNGNHD